jgi:hypothetical protein
MTRRILPALTLCIYIFAVTTAAAQTLMDITNVPTWWPKEGVFCAPPPGYLFCIVPAPERRK